MIFYTLKIVLGNFGDVQMKFKNIFFGFLKTWLLVAIFYNGSLYADIYMFLDLQSYNPEAGNFRPYTFEIDPNTGNLVKVFDTQNDFQFKTYNLGSKEDMALYEKEVRPTLLEWTEEVKPVQLQSRLSSTFSKNMVEYVDRDFSKGSLSKEIHVATYKGKIEAMSYADSIEVEKPDIDILVARPKGLIVGQTTEPKGGGSSLLNHVLQRYKEKGIERARLFSVNDDYYRERGWQDDVESNLEFESESEPEFEYKGCL
ncbi:hypothetical protein BROOK1789B_1964 [Bathymodiolus brooksi thiotrophic gill symbiont]|nr:hypothetical protein BROOK1789B_1964 [Bathymodiolus brooksi thiotrophic gill symbiont]